MGLLTRLLLKASKITLGMLTPDIRWIQQTLSRIFFIAHCLTNNHKDHSNNNNTNTNTNDNIVNLQYAQSIYYFMQTIEPPHLKCSTMTVLG